MKVGKWDISLNTREGFELLATRSFWVALESEIREKTGGCGPGSIGDWFVPDSIFGDSIFLACQIHDWMYGEGETLEDKKWADIIFLVNMTLLILAEDDSIDNIRLRSVMAYFKAVYFFGEEAFEKGETMRKEGI